MVTLYDKKKVSCLYVQRFFFSLLYTFIYTALTHLTYPVVKIYICYGCRCYVHSTTDSSIHAHCALIDHHWSLLWIFQTNWASFFFGNDASYIIGPKSKVNTLYISCKCSLQTHASYLHGCTTLRPTFDVFVHFYFARSILKKRYASNFLIRRHDFVIFFAPKTSFFHFALFFDCLFLWIPSCHLNLLFGPIHSSGSFTVITRTFIRFIEGM